MKKKLKIATVFSGIGAPEQALRKIGVDYDIVFACDNDEIELKDSFEEIKDNYEKSKSNNIKEYISNLYSSTNKPKHVKQAYFANYDIDEDRWYPDIRFLDGKQYKNKVDLYIGGSPCQSFSIIGKRGGLEDTRGTLFYEYARLIKEMQPKAFIYENVPGMLMHDKGNTWNVIKDVFESLGYNVKYQILNSKDYGIPQDRRRLFVVGIKDNNVEFEFPKPKKLNKTMFDYLEKNVDPKHYLGKKGFEFVTNPKYKNRARVNKDIIQTEKANQQFNWNGDFVFEELNKVENNKEIMDRAYVGTFEGKKGVIRQLSYRECMRLMGFSDEYKIVVPNVPAYRQAGNSIVVNVMEEVIKEILKVVSFDEED